MKFAICNETFEGWDFARACRFVKAAGYDGLEVAPFTLAPYVTDLTVDQVATLRSQADAAGVEIIGLHWLLAKTEGMHLTSADRDARSRLSQYLIALADTCTALGGHLMVFGSPHQRSHTADVSAEQAFDWAVDVFRRVAPVLGDMGVALCVEPLGPSETNFITTCEEGARLVEAVGHPNVVLHLDVKAMSSEARPVPDIIRQYGDRAAHFHANDANRRGPGFGDTDFVPIFEALDEVGYDRWVSVEVFDYSPDPETIATRSLEYMRRCQSPARSSH
jgi:sugar phosphate isomerase/epimerase